jgi:hypothetical protein
MTPVRELSAKDVAAAKSEGKVAQALFASTLSELQQLVASVDGVELMARLAFTLQYSLSREAQLDSRPSVEVFHLELLQAFFLGQPRHSAAVDVDYPAVSQKALDLVTRNGLAFLDRSSGRASEDPIEDAKLALVDQVQRWTLAVRGPRHIHQTLAFLKELSPAIEVGFRRQFGCSLADFVKLVEGIFDLLSRKLTEDREWRRAWMRDRKSQAGMVDAFCAPLATEFAAEVRERVGRAGLSRRDILGRLFDASERRLAELFTFRFEDIAPPFRSGDEGALRSLVNRLAFGFGDLAEVTSEHVHLNNPVRLRPLVKLDGDRFFWPNSASTGTGLVELVEDLCGDDEKLKKRWQRAKSDWLEAKLKRVVEAGLPHAEVWSKAKWRDDDGKGWESDVVAVIDKTVLVFEAKSGRFSPPARRGAPERLKADLQKLVVEGSVQSERFRDQVTSADAPVIFEAVEGPLTLDPKEVRQITRVTVVFDSLGSLSAHWPQLLSAELLPAGVDLAPTMSIFELETIFEVLTLELERCHYLHRRDQFEKNAKYTADELDLLAFYVDCQFNVGEAEYDGTPFPLYGASLKLTAGYSERREAGTLAFPIARTSLWKKLLAALEENRPVGWTRFGYRLLCADIEQQRVFERLVREGWRKVGRAPDYMFTTGITFGSLQHQHTVAFAIGASDPPEQFRQNLAHASRSAGEQGGQDSLLLIYWFAPATGNAYDFIGVMRTVGRLDA